MPADVVTVRGGRDPLCTSDWVAGLGGVAVTLPGLPHAFPYLDPDAFADIALGNRCV